MSSLLIRDRSRNGGPIERGATARLAQHIRWRRPDSKS